MSTRIRVASTVPRRSSGMLPQVPIRKAIKQR